MVWREGARGAFPVNQQLPLLAVHHVVLHLGNIVRNVIDNVHVEIIGCGVKHLGKRLTGEERHGAAIDPGKVRSRRHGLQVVLSLHRIDPGAGQLPVIGLDLVPLHGLLHLDQGVGSDLVAEATAARVNHHHHLALLLDAHLGGAPLVVDFVHHLDLGVVIAGTQSAQLGQPSLLGPHAHLGGIGVQHAAVLLAMLLVLRPHVSLAQRPVHAHFEGLLQIAGIHGYDALGAHTHGYVIEQGLRQLLLHRLHILLVQIRAQQTHATVDVETHAAGTYNGQRIVHVESSHVPDGKSVAGMNVGQSNGPAHDARQRGHIGYLLDARQEATHCARATGVLQLLQHQALQPAVHIETPLHIHIWLEALLDAPAVVAHFLQVPELIVVRTHHHPDSPVVLFASQSLLKLFIFMSYFTSFLFLNCMPAQNICQRYYRSARCVKYQT